MAINGKTVITAIIAALLITICIPALPATAATGTGIALAPAGYDISNGLRGADYYVTILVTNMGEPETDYAIEAEGDAGDWLSYTANGGTIQQVTIPGFSQGTFEVKISVPEDAVNGNHVAELAVTSIPDAVESGASIALRAVCYISIAVTGTQVISGTVNDISVSDVETGYPLEIQVYLENTGNVEVTPEITANITANGNIVGNVVENSEKVRAGSGEFITVEWDTTGNAAADYMAAVNVVLDGKTLATEELPFKILPLGTLTRSGELKGIEVNGAAIIGYATKMTATFLNTGHIDTWAEFAGEIYKGDQMVDTFSGEKLLIDQGVQGHLTAYFTLRELGTYAVKGWVLYEGKKTETLELTFEVIPAPTGNVAEVTPTVVAPTVAPTQVAEDNTGNNGLPVYLYIIIGLAGASVASGGYLFIWRRRQVVTASAANSDKVFKELAHNKLFKKFRFNIKRNKHSGKK